MAMAGADAKENRPNDNGNMANDLPTGDEKGAARNAGAIREAEASVQQFMQWWETGQGKALAARHPILAAIEPSQLSEVVAAGSGYHMILTLDRLDALQRKVGASSDPALEPLKSALKAGGGAKGQARVVGSLLFREARAVFSGVANNGGGNANATPAVAGAAGGEGGGALVALDEEWPTGRTFVCSQHWPPGATIAARSAPSKEGTMLTAFPEGMQFRATARSGEYLRIHVDDGSAQRVMWVPYVINGLELLVPAPTEAPKPAATAPPQPSPRPAAQAAPQPVAYGAAAVPAFAGASQQDGRVLALEQRLAQQDTINAQQQSQIQALQNEIGYMRSHICAIAGAFKPLAENSWNR